MKSLVLVNDDGSRHFIGLVPLTFDTQAWAALRRSAFCLLGIVRVEEREISAIA